MNIRNLLIVDNKMRNRKSIYVEEGMAESGGVEFKEGSP